MKSSTLALGLTGKAGYLGLLCTKGAGVGIYYSQTVSRPLSRFDTHPRWPQRKVLHLDDLTGKYSSVTSLSILFLRPVNIHCYCSMVRGLTSSMPQCMIEHSRTSRLLPIHLVLKYSKNYHFGYLS